MTCELALFDDARLRALDGTIDLNTHSFKIALLANTFIPYAAAQWTPSQLYANGDIVLSSAGTYYEALVDGRSSGVEPAFSTVRGSTTFDNTTQWRCWGLTPPSLASVWADVSAYEVSGWGYTPGGITLTNPTLTKIRRTITWRVDDAAFGAIVVSAKYAVIYRNGSENSVVDPLLAYLLLDSTGLPVTLTVDNPFTLAWTSSGIFSFT